MKNGKKRQLKGSVLFTVVCVMSILVIFLMGTLVLAASANNRAHKSYSSSQTQSTARTAMDSVLAAIGQSEQLSLAFNSLETDGANFNVAVNIDEPSMGRINNVNVSYAGTKELYNAELQKWETKKLLKMVAEVELGGVTTTATSYIVKDPSEEPGGTSPGFLTTGDAKDMMKTSVLGGTYIATGDNDATRLYQGIEDGPFGKIATTLDQKKYFNMADATEIQKFSFANNGIIEAPICINGSLYLNATMTAIFPTIGTGMSVWGDLTFQNGGLKVAAENFISSDFNDANPLKFKDIPYIHVDGNVALDGGGVAMNLGMVDGGAQGQFPINLFLGTLNAKNLGNMSNLNLVGDVYLLDEKTRDGAPATSYFVGNGSNLYTWTASIAERGLGQYTSGNIYSKGNVVFGINNLKVEKSVFVEGDVTVDKNMTIEGDLVVGGTLTIGNDCNNLDVKGKIYAQNATGRDVTTGIGALNTALYEARPTDVGRILVRYFAVKETENNQQSYQAGFMTADAIAALGLTNAELLNHTYNIPNGGGQGTVEYYDLKWSVIDAYTNPGVNDYIIEKLHDIQDAGYHAYATSDKSYIKDLYFEKGTNIQVSKETAHAVGDSDYKGTIINTIADYKTDYSTENIYPEYAERAALFGFNSIIKSETEVIDLSGKNYPHVIKTVTQVMQEANVFSSAISKPETVASAGNVGTYDPGTKTWSDGSARIVELKDDLTLLQTQGFRTSDKFSVAPAYDSEAYGGDMKLEISEDFILQGNDTARKLRVVVKPTAGGTIWIRVKDGTVLDNDSIIFDNSGGGTVNMFIEGDFSLNNGKILTSEYYNLIDQGTEFELGSKTELLTGLYPNPKSPEIYIYADENNSTYMKQQNGSMITGFVKAPTMNVEFLTLNPVVDKTKIHYNGYRVSNYYNNEVGLIGLLNCKEFKGQNDWLLLYVPSGAGSAPPALDALGEHTYASVDYTAY